MAKKKNPQVFMDVGIDGDPAETMVFELFPEVAPKTSENFRALCTGEKGIGPRSGKPLHYKGTLFHRILKGSSAQAGDFVNRDGTGGESIYAGKFPDESPKLRHDEPGLLSMSVAERDKLGSHFHITFKPNHQLDRKNVVFGKLIQGKEVLKKIERVGDEEGEPTVTVKIIRCGEYSGDKKKNTTDDRKRSRHKKSSRERRKKRRRHSSSESESSSDSETDSSESDSESDSDSSSDLSSSSHERRKKRRRTSKKDKHRRSKRRDKHRRSRRREKRRIRDKRTKREPRRSPDPDNLIGEEGNSESDANVDIAGKVSNRTGNSPLEFEKEAESLHQDKKEGLDLLDKDDDASDHISDRQHDFVDDHPGKSRSWSLTTKRKTSKSTSISPRRSQSKSPSLSPRRNVGRSPAKGSRRVKNLTNRRSKSPESEELGRRMRRGLSKSVSRSPVRMKVGRDISKSPSRSIRRIPVRSPVRDTSRSPVKGRGARSHNRSPVRSAFRGSLGRGPVRRSPSRTPVRSSRRSMSRSPSLSPRRSVKSRSPVRSHRKSDSRRSVSRSPVRSSRKSVGRSPAKGSSQVKNLTNRRSKSPEGKELGRLIRRRLSKSVSRSPVRTKGGRDRSTRDHQSSRNRNNDDREKHEKGDKHGKGEKHEGGSSRSRDKDNDRSKHDHQSSRNRIYDDREDEHELSSKRKKTKRQISTRMYWDPENINSTISDDVLVSFLNSGIKKYDSEYNLSEIVICAESRLGFMTRQLIIQKDGCNVRFYQVPRRDFSCDECGKPMIRVPGGDGSDRYTRVKEVADRKLVHQMLNDALKDVQNNSRKSPILLVTNDRDFMGVIRDLRSYGYIVLSAVSEKYAESLPGVVRLTQAFWFFEQLQNGRSPNIHRRRLPIHPSPDAQGTGSLEHTVDLVWDVNMVPLPKPIDLKSLRNGINAGLRWVNSKWKLSTMLFVGAEIDDAEEDLEVVNDRRTEWVYAPERYTLCGGCISDVQNDDHVMEHISKARWNSKEETADLVVTRYLFKRTLDNLLLDVEHRYSDTLMLVTGDCDFGDALWDLKQGGKKILLAHPSDASPNFKIGFDAAWIVSDLINGKGPRFP